MLAVASPGPDFAIVVRQSVTYGRRTAIWTAIGVGSAISLHVIYSLLGIGLLVSRSVLAFNIVKIAGALYLAWIGVKALRAKSAVLQSETEMKGQNLPSARTAWVTGFLTNALNPKATLFFVALFSVIISPQTPRLIQSGYGVWMILATMAWFSLVAVFFSQAKVRNGFLRFGHWFDRLMGGAFIALGIRLALSSSRG